VPVTAARSAGRITSSRAGAAPGWTLDLTPLRRDPTLSLQAYTLASIDCWRDQAQARLR
jgi:hypothetical protein